MMKRRGVKGDTFSGESKTGGEARKVRVKAGWQ